VADIPGLVKRLGGDADHLSDILKADVPRLLTLGEARLVYDGPTESCYFRGKTTSPFEGTVAAPFAAPVSLDIDAALKPGGQFYLDAKGGYHALGLTAQGEVKVLNNWPVVVTIITASHKPEQVTVYQTGVYADLNVNVLGTTVDLHGQVQGNGDFDVTGSADLNIPDLSGSARFDLNYSHSGHFQFTAEAHAHYGDSAVRADLDLNFQIAVDPYGRLSYSGGGTASAQVNTVLYGWQSVGTVSVGINNHEIWFSADGVRVDIYF
jgi:hypothetical protein